MTLSVKYSLPTMGAISLIVWLRDILLSYEESVKFASREGKMISRILSTLRVLKIGFILLTAASRTSGSSSVRT